MKPEHAWMDLNWPRTEHMSEPAWCGRCGTVRFVAHTGFRYLVPDSNRQSKFAGLEVKSLSNEPDCRGQRCEIFYHNGGCVRPMGHKETCEIQPHSSFSQWTDHYLEKESRAERRERVEGEMYEALGEEIEKHPIGGGGARRG